MVAHRVDTSVAAADGAKPAPTPAVAVARPPTPPTVERDEPVVRDEVATTGPDASDDDTPADKVGEERKGSDASVGVSFTDDDHRAALSRARQSAEVKRPPWLSQPLMEALWLHTMELDDAAATSKYLSMELDTPLALAACALLMLAQNSSPRDAYWNQAQVRG